MKETEILKKAMKMASRNGYKSVLSVILDSFDLSEEFIKSGDYYQYIFSHDFAKAFWGTKIYPKSVYAPEFSDDHRMILEWIFHLQQMVTEEKPLKYIERFL